MRLGRWGYPAPAPLPPLKGDGQGFLTSPLASVETRGGGFT